MTSMDRSCAFYIVRACLKLGGGRRKACGVCVAFQNYIFDIPSLKQKGVENLSEAFFLTWKTKAWKKLISFNNRWRQINWKIRVLWLGYVMLLLSLEIRVCS